MIARYQRTFVRWVRPSLPLQQPHRVLTLCGSDKIDRHTTTISTLPGDVLLDIFDFCRKDENYTVNLSIHCLWDWKSSWNSWEWHLLAHVCRRWRELVFASARRLNLRIPCTRLNIVGKNLGIWPALPIDVNDVDDQDFLYNITHEDNILAALKHVDRVYHVRLSLSDSLLEKMSTAMQEPFPVLTRFFISSDCRLMHDVPALPANFLGGSAPRLQAIGLCGIPYPALPTLLLSTSGLIKLDLQKIPWDGYISSEAMVASLAALPKLEIFVMQYSCYTYHPDPLGPPITRTVLPALAYFVFHGAREYLEDLVGRIDGPNLNHISISTPYLPGFQVAQLSRFIDQSVGPKLAQCRHAEVSFDHRTPYGTVTFNLCHHPDHAGQDRTTVISYEVIHWEFTEMPCQIPVTLSNVVHLQIKCSPKESPSIDIPVPVGLSIELFQLIRQFSAMQTLLIDSRLSAFVASLLVHFTEAMMTEALPSLELLCLEEEEYCQHSVQLDKFVAARRRSNHPVTIVNTKEFKEILDSYLSKNE